MADSPSSDSDESIEAQERGVDISQSRGFAPGTDANTYSSKPSVMSASERDAMVNEMNTIDRQSANTSPSFFNESYDDFIAKDRPLNRDQVKINTTYDDGSPIVVGSSASDISLGRVPQGPLSKFIETGLRYGLPYGIGNMIPTYDERQNQLGRDIISGKGSARYDNDGIITGIDYYNQNDNDDNGNDDAAYIRKRMAGEVIPEEATPEVSDDLALNYLQNPNYLYSGQGNLYQPYGYAQGTLVDLLRTRNLTQPQQAAANLGLFGNPGDFS